MNRELSIRLRDVRRAANGPHKRRLQLAATSANATAAAVAAAPVAQRHGCFATQVGGSIEVLSSAELRRQIEREKRRAERTGAAFSIAIFGGGGAANDDRLEALPSALSAVKRDTDLIGELDDGGLAALLPDTDARGAQRFVDKLLDRDDVQSVSARTATYPDQVFDALGRTERDAPTFDLPHALEPRSTARHALKRAIDIVGAFGAISLLSPLMLVTAAAVALTSPGPIIFRQVRLGRAAKPFVLYKFRSMFAGADERVHRDYVLGLIHPAGTGDGTQGAWAKLTDDARITPIGRFIRKTCLDELPQLFNVLKGDLSLVGPRPPLPYEAAAYEPWHLRRVLDIKPGVTGLWQVEGRNVTTFDDMVRMDLQYVRSWSLALDMRILCKTAVIILRRSGVG